MIFQAHIADTDIDIIHKVGSAGVGLQRWNRVSDTDPRPDPTRTQIADPVTH